MRKVKILAIDRNKSTFESSRSNVMRDYVTLAKRIASVRVYVGNQANCGPNSKVYLYYFNPEIRSLERLLQQEYTVDAQGYLNFTVVHNSSYIVMPKAATAFYLVQSDTPYPVGLKNGYTFTLAMAVSGNVLPTFTTGNGKIFSNMVKQKGNRY